MATDIATSATRVGDAITSIRLDEMILSLAKGIAWGQYELDKVGVNITKMMGVPGSVSLGNERLSMLEAGFLPSFYQFVDTILELKMEVKIREEENQLLRIKDTNFSSYESELGGEVSADAKVAWKNANLELGAKASWRNQSKSAYSRTIDASHAQKYNQELSASSLMRTKLVPRPPPEVLVERIRILLEQLRKEAEAQAREEAQADAPGEAGDIDERMMAILMDKIETRMLGRYDDLVKRQSEG